MNLFLEGYNTVTETDNPTSITDIHGKHRTTR
jgi:hypothetical protein